MAEDVEIPKVGKIPRKVLFPIVGVAGGFVLWRYYKSRQAVGEGDVAADEGFEDPGILPAVSGAVRGDNLYGEGSQPPSTDDFGFTGKTNSEWSQYVTVHLSQGERWGHSEIVLALGNYLTGIPLSTAQQEIVRAAIGLAGYPPVGAHPIVGGGNTPITIAPTNVRGVPTASQITVYFSPVAGASQYYVYRSNVTGSTSAPHGAGTTSPVQITGLTPGTRYTIQVAAVSSSGAIGPKSSPIVVTTSRASLGKPVKPSVSSVTKSSAHFTTKAVTFATSYKWYVQGILRASTDNPSWTATKMTPNRKYRVQVQADSSTGAPSAMSDTAYFTTAK